MSERTIPEGLPVVGLHTSLNEGELTGEKTPPRSRMRLYEELDELGAYPVITMGTESFDPRTGTFNECFRPAQADEPPGLVAHGEVTVDSLRDISCKLLPEDHTPVLNPESVRAICRDKQQTIDLAPELYVPSYFADVESIEPGDLEALIDNLPTGVVVAKPSRSRNSQGVHIGSKQLVYEKLTSSANDRKVSLWILQPQANTTRSLPGVVPASEIQKGRFEQARGPKELRTYVIDDQPILTIMRAATEESQTTMGRNDLWIFIDQDQLPPEVNEQASRMSEAIRSQAGAMDSFVAVDQFWDEEWKVMEVHHKPLVQHRGNPEAEEWLTLRDRAVAAKLIEMATRGHEVQ